ncbi:MAG: glycosyltransferase [Sphingomonas sp.]|nr:glycosyltransferase [Sphingomonas sp.]
MTRLLAFIIEGLAIERRHCFCLVLMDHIRDEAEADLKTISAVRDIDYTLHSPRDHGVKVNDFLELAKFANHHMSVTSWLTLYPGYTHAKFLDAPVSAIFPDAIPLVFPDLSEAAWSRSGHHVAWVAKVTELLKSSERVITFSEHVARDQVSRLFDFDIARTRVIRVAPPDLAPLLPFVQERRRNSDSLRQASALLRKYAANQKWDYLIDFPFDQVPYVAVSTQDRVTKNIRVVADAVSRLVREDRYDARILMTARLLLGTSWTPLPSLVGTEQLHREVVSMPDLPRQEHAAFYHCAEVAVHPSIFEGGMGTFPFYEAVSVGTPCLMADGPHQREMTDRVPAVGSFVFDPNDSTKLADLIKYIRNDRAGVLEEQLEIYEKLRARDWGDVAAEYASAATGTARSSPRE